MLAQRTRPARDRQEAGADHARAGGEVREQSRARCAAPPSRRRRTLAVILIGDHLKPFAQALAACGLETGSDGKKVTAYSLRHSSIIRSPLADAPTCVVAALHDTSVAMLERHYSPYILDHAADAIRGAACWTRGRDGQAAALSGDLLHH